MRTNVILIAGSGKRFSDAGYVLPKPLISVDGKPMMVSAANDLPLADKMVFVVSGNYVKDNSIDKTVKKYFPQATIVIQEEELKGQAHSALHAKRVVDPESILTVGTCDSGVVYDKNKFDAFMSDPGVDALIWSFRHYPPMAITPTAYGWIEIDGDDFVKEVSYKKPLSDKPLEDHAVVGHFTYKKATYCFDNVEEMISKNIKTGTEFSLDECTNMLIKNGLRVKVFKIETFLCWGTPDELRTYEYWQSYFHNIKK